MLAVTTSEGSWVAPGTRAIWVPAGTVHGHRAYGELDLHLVGLPATENPLALNTPTALRNRLAPIMPRQPRAALKATLLEGASP